ncbi:MAG: hypothetical protein R2852_00095 [Bacteroidia bacterium]
MSFTGSEDHSITLPEAAALTKNYRDANPPGVTIGHFFGMDAINSILAQPGCVGIRIYYAQDTLGDKKLVLTGVDAAENDMYTGELAEFSVKCPTSCSSANPLNS